MNKVFSLSHLNDLLTMTWLLLALTHAYRSRVGKGRCAACFFLCLTGALGSILLQEAVFPSFVIYMLLFVVWGCVYGAIALQGSFLWKMALTAEYTCIVFQLGKVASLVNSWLPEAISQQSTTGNLLFQMFAILVALFLAYHAVTTDRKVPVVCWASLMAVALISIGLTYYQMLSDLGSQAMAAPAVGEIKEEALAFEGMDSGFPGFGAMNAQSPEFDPMNEKSFSLNARNELGPALHALAVVAIVLVVQHLCTRLILENERNLVRLTLESEGTGEVMMARQVSRTEEELRRYRHETVNHLNTLSALLSGEKLEQAQALIREMTSAPRPTGDDFHSGNPLVDAIFSQKSTLCRELGIEFSADLVLTEKLPLTDAELSSLLGNLLNNAIEAARQCETPFVRARVYPARDYLCIEVVNRADEKKLRENPSMVTTKDHPELHGIGLKVVREIAQRYQGMASFETSGTDQFVAQVMIHL